MGIVFIQDQENLWKVSQVMFILTVKSSHHTLKRASMTVVLEDTQLAWWWLICHILSMHGEKGKMLILTFIITSHVCFS